MAKRKLERLSQLIVRRSSSNSCPGVLNFVNLFPIYSGARLLRHLNTRIPLYRMTRLSKDSQLNLVKSSVLGVSIDNLTSKIIRASSFCCFNNFSVIPTEKPPYITEPYSNIDMTIV
jgi:hypothetical protein